MRQDGRLREGLKETFEDGGYIQFLYYGLSPHGYIHTSKLVKWYILNVYGLLYGNYISIKKFLKFFFKLQESQQIVKILRISRHYYMVP